MLCGTASSKAPTVTMRLARNAEPAEWILRRLHPFALDVGSIIPDGFEAYARLFHPPIRRTPDGHEIPVRWRDIAAANNRTIAAEMQQLDMSSDPSRFSATGEELLTELAELGSIPHDMAIKLAGILPSFTRTPDRCWFAVWEGWGDLRIHPGSGSMFSVPQRNLFLLHGAIDDVLTTFSEVDWIYRSPNLWWPEDRAWCVATEIDFKWTYVGGSSACIDQLLADPELEALPTTPAQGNAMEK